MDGSYARGFEDGVELCHARVAIFWQLHNNKVSARDKEAASVWSYSKQEADLQEKLVEDAKIGDC